MKELIYFIVFCALISCNGKSRKMLSTSTGGIIEIDMYKEYPQKDIFIQDIADIEYISLESDSVILLSGFSLDRICMSDSLIVVHNSESTIFVFNREGKNIYAFNHLGRGGEEYVNIGKLAVDFVRQEIYINDNLQKICVYGLDGSFKRVLKLPSGYNKTFHLFNYDQESLLGCFSSTDLLDNLVAEADKRPYQLVSKKDGSLVPLPLTFQERILSSVLICEPNSVERATWPLTTIIKNGDEFLIADYGTDTIYRAEGTTLTPCILKSPFRTWKKEFPVVGWVTFKTDRYTFMSFMELSRRPNLFYKNIAYDQQTGDIFEYNLMNRDYQPAKKIFFDWLYEYDLPSGYARFKLLPTELKNDYQSGKLLGKLKEITATLDEDANPVLMLVKFRN